MTINNMEAVGMLGNEIKTHLKKEDARLLKESKLGVQSVWTGGQSKWALSFLFLLNSRMVARLLFPLLSCTSQRSVDNDRLFEGDQSYSRD